jgi:hypothetical protein
MIGRHLLLAGLALLLRATPLAAAETNDLREFRIGMTLPELPAAGYTGFACVAPPRQSLTGWQDYRTCPKDAAGWHEIGFRYDPVANPMARLNDKFGGTRVAGHPVRLALLLTDEGVVAGLRIATDPTAPLYLHKKAFLLADQVMARYGASGWTCVKGVPSAHEQPVGGVFVKEHCEKTTPSRHLLLDRELYRDPAQDLREFVGGTELLIERPDAAAPTH